MAEPAPSWSIQGEYFENCNCAVACPCLFWAQPPFTSPPTEGACEVAFAFHLDQGTFGYVSLDGLNLALIARTPGPMIEGNWSVALYVDERADTRQHEAMQAIFAGQAGGTMGNLLPSSVRFSGSKPRRSTSRSMASAGRSRSPTSCISRCSRSRVSWARTRR